MDYFLRMHKVGFNVLKIRPLTLAPGLVLFKTYCESVYFYNYIYCNDMHSSQNVSWLFKCCEGGSNIKTVRIPESSH